MLWIGLLWEESIAKAAASHQREDQARRVVVEVVAEEREHMQVAARAEHAHLALQRSSSLCAPDLARLTAYGRWRSFSGTADAGSDGSFSATKTRP